MTVRDIRKILRGRLIARNGKDDSVVFDTSVNRKEYIDKYNDAEIIFIWSEIETIKNIGFEVSAKPIILIYIKCTEE